MRFITSKIFDLLFYLWTTFICIFFISFILFSQNAALFAARLWAKGVVLLLRLICGISVEVQGKEHLPKEKAFIIASKHQSALETIAYLTIVKDPVYILKQELIKLPLYGRFLTKMGMIAIDRSGGAKTLKQLIRRFRESVSLNRPFIIFPEGTRTFIGEKIDYQIGIAAIYDLKLAPVIPTALNSGIFWPKSGIKQKGKCVIKFLPALPISLDRETFMKQLQENIENQSEQLCNLVK